MLAIGIFTTCTAEEKVNKDNKTSVVSTADVSLSIESSEFLSKEIVIEIKTNTQTYADNFVNIIFEYFMII